MLAASVLPILQRLLRPKSLAILEACLIGLVSALAAVLLKELSLELEHWRVSATTWLPDWFVFPVLGTLGGFLSGWLIQRFAPEVTGSGIPKVKAALAYVPITLNLKVAIVKLASTALALGSGLALGRQGPTVHIGAALAAQLSRWIDTSPRYQRQLIAAGAAAGLAAGFNAPISGVLFVIEELLQDVSDFTLGTAILASVVGGMVARLVGGRGIIPDLSELGTHFSISDLPFLVILGILAGLLGGLFNRGILVSLTLNRDRLQGISLPGRIAIAGGLTGAILTLFPDSLRNSLGVQDVLVSGSVGWSLILGIFVAKFFLILMAYGSGAPGGLFAPSLILGSALGSLLGIGLQALPLTLGSPTMYALAGMGAFFSAVTRGPITAIVIIFEMTTNFDLVLPLMVTAVVAQGVSSRIFRGSIYKQLLEWQGIQLSDNESVSDRWQGLTAAHIMQHQVETLSSQITFDQALKVFAHSHHRGFPVVDAGVLVGMITETDLARASQQQCAGDVLMQELMTTQLITIHPTASLIHVLHLLNEHQISRLPVTVKDTLVGIITRADIIRAESDYASGDTGTEIFSQEPSYVAYQTRGAATGQGRLLVSLSNPQTTDLLLRLGMAIAQKQNYELECLQVLLVPRQTRPAETTIDLLQHRELLDHAMQLGQRWQLSMHTQLRLAHDVSQAILETIQDARIDLVLMGWKGQTFTPDTIWGNIVDTMVRRASCDLVLVKFKTQPIRKVPLSDEGAMSSLMHLLGWRRWLVAIAGGANTHYVLKLLPTLMSLSRDPEVYLCQVLPPNSQPGHLTLLEKSAHILRQQHHLTVKVMPVFSDQVAEALVATAEQIQTDVIVLGASQDALLRQAIQGNIPQLVAARSPCNVMMLRKAFD